MGESELLADPLLRGVPSHEGFKVLGGVALYRKLGQGSMGVSMTQGPSPFANWILLTALTGYNS